MGFRPSNFRLQILEFMQTKRKHNVIKLSFVCSRKGAKPQSLEPIPLRLRVFARVIFRKK
jgi:hypothetical protein